VAHTIPLDKVIVQGVDYRTHPRVALKIKRIGTDAATPSYLEIDGKVTGNLIADVAPMRKTNGYIVGPLDISRKPLVIPPDTDFAVKGASGAKFRIIGTLYQLAPGEAVPGDLMARFKEQSEKYITYKSGSYAFGTDEAWADGTEVTLLTLTPSTIEKFKFNDIIMVDYANMSPGPGDIVIQFYLDNNPLEYLESENVERGIDLLSIPHRDDVASNEEPFSLKDFPIELKGDHTLKVTAKNVSGSSITPPSGTAISLTLYMVAEYEKGG